MINPNKVNPARNIKESLKRFAGVPAVAAALLAPAPATAEAAKTEKLKHLAPIAQVEKQATRDLNAGRPLVWANAGLQMTVKTPNGGFRAPTEKNGGVEYGAGTSTTTKYVNDPLVIYRSNSKDRFGHNDLFNGDYVFAKIIDRESTHPKVKAIKWNKDNMDFMPYNNGQPLLQSVTFFQHTELGGVDLNLPSGGPDLNGQKGGPLEDANGPLQIGREYSPKG